MATKRTRGSAAAAATSDVTAVLHEQVEELLGLRAEAMAQVAQIDGAIVALRALAGVSQPASARRAGPRAVRATPTIVRRPRRGKRGAGWAAIESALKKAGGSGKSADLKDAWAKVGGKTPLSAALASFVKSGRLKRKGKGRETVFTVT